MQFKNKLRTALVIGVLAFGISLLIIGTSANAQPAAPAPAGNASESKAVEERLPALTSPRLASMQLRISDKKFPQIEQIATARTKRDAAIKEVLSKDLKGGLNANELKPIADATAAIFEVCNIGSDYIQYRLEKNGKGLGWLSFFSGVFAAGTATTAVINSAKGLGLSTAALQSYKSGVVENGDSGHNNTELKKIQDDVKFELAAGISNYNKALLMPSISSVEKTNQYRHLQAAVIEMNNACAFF